MFPQWAALQPRICDRLICADYIPEAAPDPDIVVSKGSVSNDNTGGEGSGLGDVGNEVIADDDVAQEGAIVIKQFHPGKEQFGVKNVRTACGPDLNTFPDTFTILSFTSEKVGQTFLSTIS